MNKLYEKFKELIYNTFECDRIIDECLKITEQERVRVLDDILKYTEINTCSFSSPFELEKIQNYIKQQIFDTLKSKENG